MRGQVHRANPLLQPHLGELAVVAPPEGTPDARRSPRGPTASRPASPPGGGPEGSRTPSRHPASPTRDPATWSGTTASESGSTIPWALAHREMRERRGLVCHLTRAQHPCSAAARRLCSHGFEPVSGVHHAARSRRGDPMTRTGRPAIAEEPEGGGGPAARPTRGGGKGWGATRACAREARHVTGWVNDEAARDVQLAGRLRSRRLLRRARRRAAWRCARGGSRRPRPRRRRQRLLRERSRTRWSSRKHRLTIRSSREW